jgi:hypothetical protein
VRTLFSLHDLSSGVNAVSARFAVLAAAALLVLSGCAAPISTPDGQRGDWPADPPTDRLGWEAGYWHNESIDVNQSDGLSAAEREAFVARTMARVELIRGLEFESTVPVEVVSRETYRNDSSNVSGEGDPWNDQVWEALLLVGEDRSITEVFDELYGGAVLGYYSPSEDRIVVVSDSLDPAIDRATLAHELVHALQDQHFGLNGTPQTQDAQLAEDGLVEGDARLVEAMYESRCGAEWECVDRPPAGDGGGGGGFDFGVYLTIYTPYSEGPAFVQSLRDRGGWAAVNDAYANPPVSTEQVLHPARYPDERPVEVSVPDRSNETWSRFDHDPVGDTVGEASIYVMLWDNRAIDQAKLRENTGAYSPYNYTSGPSEGWAGDTVVPYRSDDGEFGYVWTTAWDSEEDARQFYRTYTKWLLQLRLGAERVGEDTYVVGQGPYADAFRVTRDGTRVTVVNAPTPAALDGVHARPSDR